MAPPISPTQVSDFAPEYGGCEMCWGFVKIRKVPKPPNPHAQWGVELHRQAELWLRDAVPPDLATPQGQALRRAIEAELLPAPRTVEVETPIAFSLEGVDFHGRRDFHSEIYSAPEDSYELLLGDHKSTGSIRRAREGGYMMTPDKMRADPQFLIYGYAAILESHPDYITGHWIYYPRDKGRPEAVESSESCNVVEEEMHERILPIAHRIVKAYSEPLEARPRNLKACGRFGGCPFKGICLPGISPSKRLVQMTSKNDTSPLDSVRASNGGSALERLKAKMAARSGAANDAPAEEPKVDPAEEPTTEPVGVAEAVEVTEAPTEEPKAEPATVPSSGKKAPPKPPEKPKAEKKRGRPKGSKNKPKDPPGETIVEGALREIKAENAAKAETSIEEPLEPVDRVIARHFRETAALSTSAALRVDILTRLHVAAIAAHQPPEVANTHYAAILDKLEDN